jgi:hypothetical protein
MSEAEAGMRRGEELGSEVCHKERFGGSVSKERGIGGRRSHNRGVELRSKVYLRVWRVSFLGSKSGNSSGLRCVTIF